MNNIIRFATVLFVVNLVAAAILAGTYSFTKTRIEYEQALMEKDALKQVLPALVGDRLEAAQKQGGIKYWKAFKGSSSNPSGFIFIAEKYGYSSVIKTMVGMKKDGTITGVKVLYQNETPGLGAKIVEAISTKTFLSAVKGIFSRNKAQAKPLSPYFTEQYKGRLIKTIDFDKEGLNAITGATISSKAVLDSIKTSGFEILKENK